MGLAICSALMGLKEVVSIFVEEKSWTFGTEFVQFFRPGKSLLKMCQRRSPWIFTFYNSNFRKPSHHILQFQPHSMPTPPHFAAIQSFTNATTMTSNHQNPISAALLTPAPPHFAAVLSFTNATTTRLLAR